MWRRWDIPKVEGDKKGWFVMCGWSVGLFNNAFINHRFHIRTNLLSLKAAKFQDREEIRCTVRAISHLGDQ
jgi:hypothetical protein